MSRNSKNAKRIKQARDRKGVKGPARTTCLHKKAGAWYRKGNNNNPVKKVPKPVDKEAQPA